LKRERFEQIVAEAMQQLPPRFREAIDNVAIRVQDAPTRAQLRDWDIDPDEILLGIYVGIPLTERTTNYNLVAPDLIYLFQRSIEEECENEDEMREVIRHTLFHEVAHYFGIDDDRLEELGAY